MSFFEFQDKLTQIDKEIINKVKPVFDKIESVTEYNQQKVLSAFIKHRVSEADLGISTGYGYGDQGRETLEKIMAECMGAEDSIIRHSFMSGTHTLTVALFGLLRPNDSVLCITGRPYDTITGVFGIDGYSDGSLADFGVEYNQVDLLPDGTPDHEGIKAALKAKKHKVVYIQRSRGYSLRPSLLIKDIEALCKTVRSVDKDVWIMVDNCYGEFVEKMEPCEVGADLVAGSLIKNPGGAIAQTGGYIAGRADLVEKCAYRMTSAGVGKEIGATLGHNRELFMGLFSAPHVVGEALKTAVYSAALFERLGYEATPSYDAERGDIIESVTLRDRDALIAFCQGMQSGAPVDSFVVPEPWDMPGYDDPVIMAAGAFTLGASIELSADAPLREPYAVWMQGSINFHSGKTGVLLAVQSMINKGILKLD